MKVLLLSKYLRSHDFHFSLQLLNFLVFFLQNTLELSALVKCAMTDTFLLLVIWSIIPFYRVNQLNLHRRRLIIFLQGSMWELLMVSRTAGKRTVSVLRLEGIRRFRRTAHSPLLELLRILYILKFDRISEHNSRWVSISFVLGVELALSKAWFVVFKHTSSLACSANTLSTSSPAWPCV